MDIGKIARGAGIVAAVATVLVLAAPYALVSGTGSGSGYPAQLAGYYASGTVGAAGIVLFALVSAVVIASIERGNLDPGSLAGVAVMLGVATTLSAAAWTLAIEPTTMFAEFRWLEWHGRAVVAVSAAIPVAAVVYARTLLE
ncbi:DUF7548 family protein [Halorubrum trueperi]|uniref:Uncharacterized protein n=1 Tax=Halorubrum trueperi TaxID=2004704 RepID=A0ABD5UFE0_9EURY